jgi:hypothetical protein
MAEVHRGTTIPATIVGEQRTGCADQHGVFVSSGGNVVWKKHD